MYFKKTDRDFINERLENIENMIAEMKIIDKHYIKIKDEEIINLYDEKYSFLKVYIEDIKNTLNKGVA